MELCVRRFDELSLSELYEIMRLRVRVFVVEQNCPYMELDGRDRTALHLWLWDETGIVAYLRVLDRDAAHPDVSIGRVLCVRRRQGLASRLLREGIRAARREFGARRIALEAQVYAKGLYEKQGFRQVSGEFLEDGIPHVRMLLECPEERAMEEKNMHTTLIVMAAGLASRYGGGKQTAGMGPNGEILLEYSVWDAIRAGFDKAVFIIRPEMLDDMKRLCGDRLSEKIEVCYAFQDFSSLPEWYAVPEGRVKPFGTVHAVLCARDVVREPFAVLNADDYYGPEAFRTMHDFLVGAGAGRGAMVGYRLKNTVSANGAVTRAVCRTEGGRLSHLEEVQKIRLFPDGRVADTSGGEPGVTLDPDALVSMNFWGFPPEVFGDMADAFDDFLRGLAPGDIRGEYQLPVMVDRLLRAGKLSVDVLACDSAWFGVTYQEDKPQVQAALKALHDAGVYPERL